MQAKLATLDGTPQVRGEVQSIATVAVLVWTVQRVIAASRFGGVHGDVCMPLEHVGVSPVLGRDGDADARADVQ